jgi:FMN phosphatase YigB (HAD superfamily)
MLKAVLFDLDNTLILYDEMEFFKRFIPRITDSFRDIIPPDIFADKLVVATQSLMRNDGSLLNRETFLNVFTTDYEEHRDELWDRLLRFYTTELDQFRHLVAVPLGIEEVFDFLKRMHLKVVIASNPIWPREGQIKRFSWTGIEHAFDFITHMENMFYCKPRLEYYTAICDEIEEKPEECLMVGNDLVNDMVAAKIGIKTFLMTDGIKTDESSPSNVQKPNRKRIPDIPEPDFIGRCSELSAVIEELIGEMRS